jgi:hypothetical protein
MFFEEKLWVLPSLATELLRIVDKWEYRLANKK